MKCAFILVTLALLVSSGNSGKSDSSSLILITDDNWSQILEGEWMIEFFAPWCPACRNLQSAWEEFATWSKDLEIRVGQVDITNSPGLSGRFMITALPTIYHVKEGEFRQYKSPRTKEDFLSFVEDKKWEKVEPISSWQSPASIQMSLLSQFYRVSMALRNVMNVLTDEYGIPVWSAYLIFGGITILIGLLLGLILVFIIDCVYPQQKKCVSVASKASVASNEKEAKPNEIPDDEIVDDEGSQAEDEEENEDNEEKEEENAPSKAEGSGSPDAAGGARKRRARKAD